MTPTDVVSAYVAMLYVLSDRYQHLSDQQVSDALDLMIRIDANMLQSTQAFVARVLSAESRDDIEVIKSDGVDLFGIDVKRMRMN